MGSVLGSRAEVALHRNANIKRIGLRVVLNADLLMGSFADQGDHCHARRRIEYQRPASAVDGQDVHLKDLSGLLS